MENENNMVTRLNRKDYTLADDASWIYWLVFKTRDVLVRVRENELKRHGVSATESEALYILNDIGDMATPTELSRRMFREPNTVTALLSRMEKKELIKKSKDLKKKNIWRVAVTEKGKRLNQQCIKMEAINNVISNYPKDEQARLISCLEKLHEEAFKRYINDSSESFLKSIRV